MVTRAELDDLRVLHVYSWHGPERVAEDQGLYGDGAASPALRAAGLRGSLPGGPRSEPGGPVAAGHPDVSCSEDLASTGGGVANAHAPELGGGTPADQALGVCEAGWGGGE